MQYYIAHQLQVTADNMDQLMYTRHN